MRLRFKTEPALKFFRVCLRRLRIYPPCEIENLGIGVLACELIEVYNNINIIHCNATQRNYIRECNIPFLFLCTQCFQSRFDILEVVIVFGYPRTLRVMNLLIRSIHTQIDNLAGFQNIVGAPCDIRRVANQRYRHPFLFDVVHQFDDTGVKHRFATPDIPNRGPPLINNLVHEVFIDFNRNFALFEFFERFSVKVTVITPLPARMATEVAHIGNSEAYQLNRIAFAVLRTERVSPVETLLGELITHELARSPPVLRHSGGKFTNKKS